MLEHISSIDSLFMISRKLLLAYGNPDRQDDGASWYVLESVAAAIGQILSDYNEDFYSRLGNNPDFFFTLQLTPELADFLITYDEVCFIDASVGSGETGISISKITPEYQVSPLSHHMSPKSLLEISKSVHDFCPDSYLLTIPGVEFGFTNQLSVQAKKASDDAIDWLIHWIQG